MKKNQSGFTLVEIAIVLVIIGLLLGGVLKGQELINSAKSKAVITDFRNTATMIAAYQDRFRALPGDDKTVSSHLTDASLAEPAETRGNGLVDGTWNSEDHESEAVLIWQHLRLANLASGDTQAPSEGSLDSWRPKNTEGGVIGVQSSKPVTSWTGRLFVCQANISGRIALQVDTTMDDGKPDQGSVRFGVNAAAGEITPATQPTSGSSGTGGTEGTFKEDELYTICTSY